MGVRDGDVTSALDVTPTVIGEGYVNRVVISKDGRGVDDECASHIFGEVVTRDLAVGEVGKRELLSLGEVCFLEADNVALGDKISKGARDEIFASDSGDLGGVEGEAINIIGEEARHEGRGGGEGGETRGPIGKREGRRGGLVEGRGAAQENYATLKREARDLLEEVEGVLPGRTRLLTSYFLLSLVH